ncbi:traB domain-containing protein [Cinnamomum micranthum f. kanehirae]|uniref:TraB domain-containing protein n=1 Tax=Cinnamomum micranthum f. kanehirae TaxID=337451 RepID=A0A443P0P5_9MAGN|nr:traB domain-containing protein [Cinnamomum micranthum f. kanehirae]
MLKNQYLLKPVYLRNQLFHYRTTTRPFSSQIRLFTSLKTPLPRQKAPHFPPAMEANRDTSPESDAPIPEDFVHVRNPDDSQVSADEAIQNATPNSSPSAKSSSTRSSDAIADDNDDDLKTSERDDFDAVGESTGLQVVHLPEELSKSVVFLECESTAESGTCHVYLVGTAHVSEESCREVQAVIRYLKPQVADKLEVLPGSEFRVAFEEAMSYGAKVILGDRPVQLKEMDDVDMLTLVIQEMSREFPTLMETLLYERDLYMSSTLLKVASEHSSVVAVVGKGHLQGIKKHWKQPIEVKGLLDVPVASSGVSAIKILASVGVAVTGVAIISGIYLSSKRYVAGIRCTPFQKTSSTPETPTTPKSLQTKQTKNPYPNPSPSASAKSSSASSSDAIADDNDEDLKTSERGDFDAVGESTGLQAVHLPEELSKSVVFLECESTAESGTCHVYLVGTAHVSEKSCREVQAVIRCLKPQVVFLELCSDRVAVLSSPKNLQVGAELGVIPGSEFRVAFEEAMSYGAKITSQRIWGKMSLWLVAKLLFTILCKAIYLLPSGEDLKTMVNRMLKEMDDIDRVTQNIQEMSRKFPTLMETLVYERDLYMSSTLLKVASKHSSVVAVVGKGHLLGIKKHWKQPIEVKGLLDVPVASSGVSAIKILASVGVAVTGVAFISGMYLSSKC